MATYVEYAEAVLSAFETSILDPANLTGKQTLTVSTDDDTRYLDTLVNEFVEIGIWRLLSSIDGYIVTPTGEYWRESQEVEE